MFYRHTHTHTHKKQALLLFLVLCLPSSSFKAWVSDLNLNKGLEPMSDTSYKYFLHSKTSFNSLYSLNLFFLHAPECNLLVTEFLDALFIYDKASLESSEEEVKSMSLLISETHCFLLLPRIFHLFNFLSKNFLSKTILAFFRKSQKTKCISLVSF